MTDILRHILKDKLALLGFIIIMVIIGAGLLAPYISPHDPIKVELSQRLQEPNGEFLMGTDHQGRCILSRVIHGTRLSLRTSFLVLVIIMTMGILVGTVSGYTGGKVDSFIVSIIDILLAFPGLVLALAIAGMLGPGITNVMLAIAAVHWVGYARIVRGMVVSIKEKEYVMAARAAGTTHVNIVLRHVLPNILSPVIVLATLDMGAIILSISGISFLGLGAQPPIPEWGAMLNDSLPYMQTAPWLMLFPGLAIFTTVLSFNLMGDGLRDIFDPRSIRRTGPAGPADPGRRIPNKTGPGKTNMVNTSSGKTSLGKTNLGETNMVNISTGKTSTGNISTGKTEM